MRVLVTGAGGFVGRHLVSTLSGDAFEIVAHFRSSMHVTNSQLGGQVSVGELSDPAFDIPDGISAIIHAAARSPYHGGTEDDFIRDNVEATKVLTSIALRRGVKKLIFLSGMSVYGDINQRVIDETSPTRPTEPYGQSKLAAETFLALQELPTLVLRLPGVIGQGAHSPWVARAYETLKAGGTVNAYNPDGAFNNVLHVHDICRFVGNLLYHSIRQHDMLTLASSHPMKISDVMQLLQTEAGNLGRYQFNETSRSPFTISISKASRLYKFNPMSTEAAIRHYAVLGPGHIP
jgi:nucleoside-diphosphate-sugar epimerase